MKRMRMARKMRARTTPRLYRCIQHVAAMTQSKVGVCLHGLAAQLACMCDAAAVHTMINFGCCTRWPCCLFHALHHSARAPGLLGRLGCDSCLLPAGALARQWQCPDRHMHTRACTHRHAHTTYTQHTHSMIPRRHHALAGMPFLTSGCAG